ncbi:uroplakin-2 [Hoplias malabaricus]|uniref:uroplakin-2 n=1 Tax=Hoplias malabaricus TaxID=27720 RepID=UPI003461C7E9
MLCPLNRPMLRAEMLAVLFILRGLVPFINADFPARVLTSNDGVMTGQFLDSLLLSLPPCELEGQSVDLEYLNVNTNENKTLTSIFTVPSCTNVNTIGSTAFGRNIGYQLMNLSNGTAYRLHYKVGNVSSVTIFGTTITASDYNGINDGLPARSGAMVVITVILSVTMLLLLICLILSLALSTSGN